jgi:(p)ppGpp synthase/HD superfamily hydrolase
LGSLRQALRRGYGGNENEVITGLLHDAVEDQGGRPTLKKIKKKFGARVATIVEACSDSFETAKLPWLENALSKVLRAVFFFVAVQVISSLKRS